MPRCDDPSIYGQIVADSRSRYWASSVTVVDIDARKAPTRKYWPQDMPRRFCEGAIKTQSGAESPINYPVYFAIIGSSSGYDLAWCVVGLDRQWAYDPQCRLARP